MTNKEMIKKLRDNTELAWASYGYYDRLKWNNQVDKDIQIKRRLNKFKEIYAKLNDLNVENTLVQERQITLTDILNIDYKSIFDGDFSPYQVQNFFKRYDLLIHQPNTSSGFCATLFYGKETQEFILAVKNTGFNLSTLKQSLSNFFIFILLIFILKFFHKFTQNLHLF